MATYNGATFIGEQLRSFAEQTRLPDEVVITDDGSSDGTLDRVAEFSAVAPFPVRFFSNEERLGYAGNFNSALQKVTGDLVLLSDQDDVWLPGKIAHLEQLALQNADKLLFMNDAELTDALLNPTGLTKLGQLRSAGLGDEWFIMGCCCAVRRELLNLCLPIPESFNAHDAWIVAFAIGLDGRIVSENVMQYYRRHGNNESEFAVNSTRRVTKWNVMKQQLQIGRAEVDAEPFEDRLCQLRLFCQGVVSAIGIAKQPDKAKLERFLAERRSALVCMEKRVRIRRAKLPSRIFAAISFWARGGYARASGFKSAIRDMVRR